jgi:peptidoglycan/xylan/chitin deacetylase (PgdA/CDA1 family)
MSNLARSALLTILVVLGIGGMIATVVVQQPGVSMQLAAVPTVTSQPTRTATPAPRDTATPRPTRTATPEPRNTPTRTATPAPSSTPTATPEPPLEAQAAQDMGYVPILMYHYVRSVDPEQDELGYRLSVTPEVFAEQMAWLDENDYTPITAAHLADCLRGWRDCPERPVVLSFDDGYEDAYTEALPILEAYGFTGTFYVVTEFVGRPGYMSWEQIRSMHASGMEIGSHSLTHPDLALLDAERARAEITESRELIESELGARVRSFCYPIGSYSPEVAAMVLEAGYTNAVTTYPGVTLDLLYELPRQRILGGESLAGFAWHVTPPE